MITYIHGDLFYSPARVLVNPVNTVGAMGSGTAYDFKRFFPDMYEQYREFCQQDNFAIGQLMLYRTPHKWILNFPIKKHFRAKATLDNIEDGLKKFVRVYAEQHLTSVSFPALGTEEDDLDWEEVKPMMESYLDPLPISVFVHIHTDKTSDERRSTRAMKTWLNGRPSAVSFDTFWKELFGIISNDLDAKPYVTFKAAATNPKGRQRASIKLTPKRGETVFLPETQLRDLWQYVTRAGYVLPQNLPAGLEQHASMIMVLLSQVSMLRPIQLERQGGEVHTGLQYIPPIERRRNTVTVKAN